MGLYDILIVYHLHKVVYQNTWKSFIIVWRRKVSDKIILILGSSKSNQDPKSKSLSNAFLYLHLTTRASYSIIYKTEITIITLLRLMDNLILLRLIQSSNFMIVSRSMVSGERLISQSLGSSTKTPLALSKFFLLIFYKKYSRFIFNRVIHEFLIVIHHLPR